jgi:hypothetical protein
MNAEPAVRANFDTVDFAREATNSPSRPGRRRAATTVFLIAFAVVAGGVQALWMVFLIWLPIRAIF